MGQTNREFATTLRQTLESAPVNSNKFYVSFRDKTLTDGQMKRFAEQYFWFCKSFIRTLAGLIANTPDNEEDVRLELVKTLYSELGYGKKESIHLNLLRKFTKKLGLTEEYLNQVKPIPEIENYIKDLKFLFGKADFRKSMGAEFGVEATAATEFTYLYSGLKKYEKFSKDDIIFFEFHVTEEQLHGDWTTEAIIKLANTEEDRKLIQRGAMMVAESWENFWNGMYRYVFEKKV